ncbi:MAG TPA: 50S ribosomal protein L21 [Gammaproteobacteria bacterium]|jgi:large subunit ribosomal protein L21|nr:50S ribosomal protein L21 [Gammaproteobacteria bacterium]
MYAVILSGGKQYRVEQGDVLKLESLPAEVGSDVSFDKVLLVGEGENIQLGAPYLSKGKVSATVLSQGRHKKIKMVKFGRRKHHEKWQGHRQDYTEVQIKEIAV